MSIPGFSDEIRGFRRPPGLNSTHALRLSLIQKAKKEDSELTRSQLQEKKSPHRIEDESPALPIEEEEMELDVELDLE